MSQENSRFASTLNVNGTTYAYYPVSAVAGSEQLPYSLTVLLENVLRNAETPEAAEELAARIVEAGRAGVVGSEIEFSPARVLFQDFTGVPVFVDFAVMREACAQLGGDPTKINPQIPCDLVIDHSVIADVAGCAGALAQNMELEFSRNKERYDFLKWSQESFENVRIVPPGAGICHQLNIEQFAHVTMTADGAPGEPPTAYFDTLVGTDSHTPTANGIGVLGWGVGGIEAEAAALGQPITTLVPKVVGVRLTGELGEGVAAMDVALSFAQMLRAKGVVGCFVECFGPGLDALSATYAEVIEFDLGSVERSLAGPSRPHDRIPLAEAQERFRAVCDERGLDLSKHVAVDLDGEACELTHGALAIAAVTSCTTATDPSMMLAAGLVAKKAADAGLKPQPWVKCVLAPGSKATELLLERAGLLDGLRALGFYTCGFGCMSCIGNSGPILDELHEVAEDIELASVLSGNRNFEGRISPDVSQNYLAAPAAVIAYALAGTMDADLEHDALGTRPDGTPVLLADIWPSDEEIAALVAQHVDCSLYEEGTRGLYDGDAAWAALGSEPSDTFSWDDASTYVRRAPYFDGMEREPSAPKPVEAARALALLGDFITTDHISPAGSIAADSPAARYLEERGVAPADFNTYGARRGNHEVMMRGTFANVKLQNKLAEGKKGGWTRDFATGEVRPLFDAAMDYEAAETPLVVVAGKMYGSGSSRDWAAKGPALLGIRAAFAESFERIHRSNLIGMGILPLQFQEGESAESLGLDGSELYTVAPIDFSQGLPEPRVVDVTAERADGQTTTFRATVRVDTPTEGRYYQHGGILPFVLRSLL